jgi:hypothetical protein
MLMANAATSPFASLSESAKSLPIYALTVAKGGPKLPPAKTEADSHRAVEGLPRIQKPGSRGFFDIALKSAPSAMLQENGPSLFTLIQEQLGLKLVPAKAPVEVLVIDHVEKLSEN